MVMAIIIIGPSLYAATLLFLFLVSSSICTTIPKQAAAGGSFDGMFVFGGSVVDNGNNNYLATLGRANYSPYGVDFFPLGPTGRFSNGKNVADLLGQLLGIPRLLPPFLDPSTTGSSILSGVNYGSGGSGILDDTGSITGQVMNLNQQISNFEEVTLPMLESQLSSTRAQILPRYLFLIAAGANDYQFNYFLRGSGTRVSLDDFTDNLIQAYAQRLKRLYNLGARKFALLGANPIGCVPVVRGRTPRNRCQNSLNLAAKLFNTRLKCQIIGPLKAQLPGSNFVLVSAYNIIKDIIRDPASRGFSNVKSACCQLSSLNGVLCMGSGGVCSNRSSYAFFDAQHATEAVSAILASKAHSSLNLTEVYPINVHKLSQL